jgi:hypothetical protein
MRPVGVELFHADRRTDRQADGRTDRHSEANSRFSQFCERASKLNVLHLFMSNICNMFLKGQVCVI